MTIVDMLGQSGILTLLGMGVVFLFLIIMIVCMYTLHGVLHLFGKDVESQEKSPSASSSVSATPVVDNNAVIAAIAAAVHDKELNS